MSHVETARNLGPHRVPGADHKDEFDKFAMAPGAAYRLADDGSHTVVRIDEKVAKAAVYDWVKSWIEGRTVAEFVLGPVRFAQPTNDDPRRTERKVRTPRVREAPGVAPPVEEPAERPPARARTPKAKKPLSIVL